MVTLGAANGASEVFVSSARWPDALLTVQSVMKGLEGAARLGFVAMLTPVVSRSTEAKLGPIYVKVKILPVSEKLK